MKLLIGYDGSSYADAAVDELHRAGLGDAVEAKVLAVADVFPQPPPTQHRAHALAQHAMDEARKLAEQGGQRLRRQFPGWRVEAQSCADSPYWALVKIAEQWRADLVVVGSQGRGAIGRLMLGSVSQNVVTHAPCSVRVSRRGNSSGGTVRMVVGFDGSPHAQAAVRAVASRHWPPATEARVVTALDVRLAVALPTMEEPPPVLASGEDERALAARATQAAAQTLSGAGLVATATVRDGDPRMILLDEAAVSNADCIFVGAKGLSRLQRFLLGSVSGAVAANATCSVEVVRDATIS